MKLSFTALAVADLQRLRDFIAQDNPLAARRVSEALQDSIARLLDHPQLGRIFDEHRAVRMWVSGDYVVHYLYDGHAVTVLRVWHGKEQHPSL